MAPNLPCSPLPLHHVFLLLLLLLFQLPFLPPAVIAADLTSDSKALLAFSASVPHARELNWTNSSSMCLTWSGVTCSRDTARVVGVRLPGRGLRGPIPRNTLGRLDALEVLSLRSNQLSGSLPDDVLSLPRLRHLFLQRNSFDGTLPLFSAPSLAVLDLSSNRFSGEIPSGFQNLTQLNTLYLQNNSLTGPIPDIVMPKLRTLNLSYNNHLNGSIPSSFRKFPITSYLGIPLLCGFPLAQCSPAADAADVPSPSPSSAPTPLSTTLRSNRSGNKISTGLAIVIAVGALAILMVLALIVFICLLCAKDREEPAAKAKGAFVSAKGEKPIDLQLSSGAQEASRNKLLFFEGCPYSFDLEDLLRASAEVLGKGSFGTAYKAILEDGTTLVVKRLKEVVVGRREFEQQMEVVGGIGLHPNVVPLRAYYYSKDEKLLVYEYMPGGSLCSWLHGSSDGQRRSLNWDSRVHILLGAARGISHIHSKGGAKSVHGNIRSSNTLLTQDGDGGVSDSGLAPLMNFIAKPPSMVGYLAPEVIDNQRYSQKSDIYSFGVLILEMLTGKAPFKSLANDDTVDLPGWVQSVVREEWTAEVFDAELTQYPDIEEELVQMLQAGIMCVAAVPEQRPGIEEVIRMIEGIRQPGSADRSKGFIDFTTTPQDSS